jgi:hypothetical protein
MYSLNEALARERLRELHSRSRHVESDGHAGHQVSERRYHRVGRRRVSRS